VNVGAFDGADCLDAAKGRLGRSQGSEAMPVSEEPFHGRVIALDQIVPPLSIDVPDAAKVRIIPVIDLTGKAMMLEGESTRHVQLQKRETGQTS